MVEAVWEYEENSALQAKPLLVAVGIDQDRSIHPGAQQHHTLLCSPSPGSTELVGDNPTSASGGGIPEEPLNEKKSIMTIFCRFGAKMMALPSPRLRALPQAGAFPEPPSLLRGLDPKAEQAHQQVPGCTH